jgi:hypothetical protein
MLTLCAVAALGGWASVQPVENGTTTCTDDAACAEACVARARVQNLCSHPTTCTQFERTDRPETDGRIGKKQCRCGWPEPVSYIACTEYDSRLAAAVRRANTEQANNIGLGLLITVGVGVLVFLCGIIWEVYIERQRPDKARAARVGGAQPCLEDDGLGSDDDGAT